jgi:molecular chaperone GrpE
MVFGNQFDRIFDPQKNSRSNDRSNSISLEELKKLKEKAKKYNSCKNENEELTQKNKELEGKIEDLTQKLDELKEKNEDYLQRLQRLQADFENYRKRVDRDNANYKRYATQKILRKLIEHYDDLKRAKKVINALEVEDSVKKGFQMIAKNFKKLLQEEGVKPMKCEGEKFDPYKHDAMMVMPNEAVPENTVLEELEKGYYFDKEVLRPAKVVVSKKSC